MSRPAPAPDAVVRRFLEEMQARNWDEAGACLSPSIRIEYTETGEVFEGPSFLAMNRDYPDGWSIHIAEVLSQGDRVAAQFRVDHGNDVFWCAGFYTISDELIVEGVEHWLTAGSLAPPEWRAPYRTT